MPKVDTQFNKSPQQPVTNPTPADPKWRTTDVAGAVNLAALLTGVNIRFDTTTDDKDDDTLVWVYLKLANGTVIAEIDNLSGHWDNGSTVAFNLFIAVQSTRQQLVGGEPVVVEVHIQPNGNDTWDFNATLTLSFSDGTNLQNFYGGHWLSQDNQTNDYVVNGLAG